MAIGAVPLDRAPRPALRLLESQVLLAVVVHDFDAPPHRVPCNYLFGARFKARGIKRLLPAPAFDSFRRHHAQRPSWSGMQMGHLIGQARCFTAPVDLQRHPTTAPLSIACGVGSRSPNFRGRPLVPALRCGGGPYNRASFTSRLVRSQFVGKKHSRLWPP